MLKLIKDLLADESGASFTEYAILVSTVGLAVVAAGLVFSPAMKTLYTNLTAEMVSWVP
jgi:Flp pilus assembly pilin Flp